MVRRCKNSVTLVFDCKRGGQYIFSIFVKFLNELVDRIHVQFLAK